MKETDVLTERMQKMKVIKDICYVPDGNPSNTLDIYLPEAEEFKVFIYFHGGGLEGGDKIDAEPFAGYMVQNGIAVVSCNYRMYPSAVYPEFIRDTAAAIGWVFGNISAYGTASEIYAGGSSAGGYLSMMICFDKKYLSVYGIQPKDIAGFIHDAGQPTKHFNILREEGIDPGRVIIDEAAPIYHVGCETEYPPMLFILAENDMENRYEQTMLMISALKHFGLDKDVSLKILSGEHCQYISAENKNGENEFASAVIDFIK